MTNIQKIAIDFDGVIHKYSKGWQDGKIYDVPVEGSIKAIKQLLEFGFEIVIFSTRADTKKRIEDMQEWLSHYGLHLEITNKKPIATVYIDDRAIRFTNWGDILKYFL